MMEKRRCETKEYLKRFEECLEREIPYCTAACPFHLPVFNFMEKVQRGAFTAAFKVYRDAAGFPRIASALCSAPCKNVCPREGLGGAVELGLLEQTAIRLASSTAAVDYNIPPQKERVAIVGAGLSGMAACLRLATKKYHVEVFEAADRIGGQLWDLMPPEIFLKDIQEQLAHQEYVLHLQEGVTDIASLAGAFDAVYVATGKGGADFGLLTASGDTGDPYCMRIGETGVFAGGALTGKEPVYALADGLAAGTVIDNFLKTGKLYYPPNERKTRMCAGMALPKETAAAAAAADSGGYTKEEAAQEAARCIRCQCSACREHCDLTAFADKWPVRIRDEIVATTLEGKSELKATPAKRLMSLCNQCGLCKEVCPQAIDMDGLFLAGRAVMHRQGKTPWPFYDFWLRDMRQADEYGLTRPAPGHNTCQYAFFPGCQLGASEPLLTEKTYAHLLRHSSRTGLMLRCCGVPLEWAGQVQAFSDALDAIRRDWEELGKPVMLLACPTCMKKFREHLPELPVQYIYEVLARDDGGSRTISGNVVQAEQGQNNQMEHEQNSQAEQGQNDQTEHEQNSQAEQGQSGQAGQEQNSQAEQGQSGQAGQEQSSQAEANRNVLEADKCADQAEEAKSCLADGLTGRQWAVFDACPARHDKSVKQAVRKLAEQAGYRLTPLAVNEVYGKCCGYGGQGAIANPDYQAFVADRRIAESEAAYITYCINCRDVFLDRGKEAAHILSLLLGDGSISQRAPSVTRRQENRVLLRQLLARHWGEKMQEAERQFDIKVHMSQALLDKLNKERILEEDMVNVIDFCQRHDRRIWNAQAGTYCGYRQVGMATYWAEYRQLDEDGQSFELVNAYSHRMKIELEAVWNGERQNLELQ